MYTDDDATDNVMLMTRMLPSLTVNRWSISSNINSSVNIIRSSCHIIVAVLELIAVVVVVVVAVDAADTVLSMHDNNDPATATDNDDMMTLLSRMMLL